MQTQQMIPSNPTQFLGLKPQNQYMQATLSARHRRFGYNPGLKEFVLHGCHARKTGFGEPVPLGLKAYETIPMDDFNPSLDPTPSYTPTVAVELLANDALGNVLKESFANLGGQDRGYRELQELSRYNDDDAAQIYLAVHPAFITPEAKYLLTPDIEFFYVENDCPNGLTESCATCRLKHLQSPETVQRIETLPIQFQDSAQITLDLLIGANKAFIEYAKMQWSEIKGELKMAQSGKGKAGIIALRDGHYWLMDNIHETEPELEQVLIAKQMAEQNANSLAAALKENNEASDRRLEALMLQMQKPSITTEDLKDVLNQIAELRAENSAFKQQLEQPKKK